MKTICYKGDLYPKLQTEGFAAQYAFPFAKKMLSGDGLDIGCSKPEWAFPGATPIDIEFDDNFDAMNLPDGKFDYIFSSHCLEHLPDWVGALEYWRTKIKDGKPLFLYLPHYDQKYWRPWNNRKHINVLTPNIIEEYFHDTGWFDIMVTKGYDLNHSFYAVATV